MTNIRQIINNALAANYDVIITDGNYWMERMCGGGWTVVDEWGWNSTEEEVDAMVVVSTKQCKEGFVLINVVSTGW